MTRALVIVKAGDPEMAGAIENGIRVGRAISGGARRVEPLGPEERRIVKAEMDRQRARKLVRVAVGNTKTEADYDLLVTRARADIHELDAEPGAIRKVGRWMLGMYGLLCLGIAEAYRRQDIVLGRRS